MADGSFHPLRETGFSHYERVGEHWSDHEKDGSRAFFGLDLGRARIADPDHPERIQSWLLERQEDAHGNAIDYGYERHDGYPLPGRRSAMRDSLCGLATRCAPRPSSTAAPVSCAASRGAAARSACTWPPTTAPCGR